MTTRTVGFDPDEKIVQVEFFQDSTEQAAVSYGIEMIDDRGNYILPPTKQDVFVFSLKSKETKKIALPKELKDGYYIFKIKYAFVGSELEAFFEHDVYLESREGHLKEITAEDLYTHSAMNMSIDDPTGEKGGEQ